MIPLAIYNYQCWLAFEDLTGSAYYLSPVLWAAKKGITTGKSATTFDPGGNCTRAETVTFLYRLAGSPEVSETKNPFKDVKESDYFYKPVLWAMEKGITTGKQADTFAPDDPCTRAEFVTFLWRYDGGDPNQIMGSYVLDDVNPFNYFYQPVGWAFKNEITTGTSAMTFSPNRGVNRGEAVTFLYRYYKKFIYPSESADEQEDKTEDVGPSETEKESEKENKNDENKDEALI